MRVNAVEAKTASTLVSQGKRSGKYKSKPGDRNSARLASKFEGSSVDWFSQDINMLFKTGRYLFSVPVQGETGQYTVTIEVDAFLPMLEKALQANPFNVPTFQKVLTQAFTSNKLKVACTCPDQLYRWQYAATVNDTNAGRPENRPAVVTNPTGEEGYCKHILMVLQNRIFAARIARNLFNYVFDLWKKNRALFDRIIRPGLNITDEQIQNRPIKPRYANKQPQLQPAQKEPAQPGPDGVTESVNSYYQGRTNYDDDQSFVLEVTRDSGADISLYVTPENTPEQMSELARALQNGASHDLLRQLGEASLPPSSIALIAKAALGGVDLLPYKDFAPDVLNQLLRGAKYGVPLSAIALRGFNAKQIEQATSAFLRSKSLFNELVRNKYNYQQMRNRIAEYDKTKNR